MVSQKSERGLSHPQAPKRDAITARVMARVRAEQRTKRWTLWHWTPWRWTLVGAVAASIMVGVFVQQRRAPAGPSEAEIAEAELLMSLQVAGAKINKAREAVLQFAGEDSQ